MPRGRRGGDDGGLILANYTSKVLWGCASNVLDAIGYGDRTKQLI